MDSRQGNVPDLDIIVAPLVEQQNGTLVCQDLLGQDRSKNLDVPVVGHVDCAGGVGRGWRLVIELRALRLIHDWKLVVDFA